MNLQPFRYSEFQNLTIFVTLESIMYQHSRHSHLRMKDVLLFFYTLTNTYLCSIFFRVTIGFSTVLKLPLHHSNDEQIGIKFIKIKINKRQPDHALQIIHGYTSYSQLSSKTQPHQQNKHLLNESKHLLNIVF